MSRREKKDDLAQVWRALANPIRREMLDVLRDKPRTTGELVNRFPALSRFAVMQHLKVLEKGNLVVHIKQGRQRFNYLNPVPIQQIYHRWVRQYEGHLAESMVAMKARLERGEAS